jgi:hypothetical protein
MPFSVRTIVSVLAASIVLGTGARGDEKKVYSEPPPAPAVDEFFMNEVWTKVVAQSCLKCHKPDGEADELESKFILQDPDKSVGPAKVEALRNNRKAFIQMARLKEGDQSRLLLKAVGKLDHGGKEALKPDSAGYRILAEFVTRLYAPPKVDPRTVAEDKNAPPFFDGIVMLDDRKLLRRITLSLAGRLPTESEVAAIASQGRQALPALLDAVMKEEAFYARLREGFNDIFLTIGVDGNPEQSVLSYDPCCLTTTSARRAAGTNRTT